MLPGMSQRAAPLFGAIEAGGTKFECAVARDSGELIAAERIATASPLETFAAVRRFFFDSQAEHGAISAFGMASFGPLNLDADSPGFGCMLSTPKAGWSHVDMVRSLQPHVTQAVGIDTDVNAAALAESQHPANTTLQSLVYVTVGTGIGGGAVLNGITRHGRWHPEMGHIPVRRHPQDLSFPGVCPFHQDCLEGLASGPAIVARWGRPMSELLSDETVCDVIGDYLAQLAMSLTLLLAPERVIFGGGVMSGGALLPLVRRQLRRRLAGYPAHPLLAGDLNEFIVNPAWGERAGINGAIVLARRAAATEQVP
jgi:fructokinase